jgi:RNA polymerase sigma factor (sigma-70 family)
MENTSPAAPEPLGDVRDDEDMLHTQQGNAQAFERLVRRYEQPIRRYLTRMVGPAEAMDLAQETFVTLWTQRHLYEPRLRFRVFIYQMARNKALSHLRWRKVRSLFGERPVEETAPLTMGAGSAMDALDLVMKRQHAVQLQRLLQALAPDLRDILVLRYVEGMDYPTMAEVTGVSAVALRSRVHRAVAQLAERIPEARP